MNIGIDIRPLMHKRYSGVPEYTLNLVTEILKQDKVNQYKFFYNSFGDVSQNIPKFEAENLKLIYTKYPNKVFNWVLQKYLNYPRIDKMIDVDIFFMPNLCPVALSKKSKKILTVHDLSFLRYPKVFSVYRRAWHAVINIKSLIKKFDKIIAVSESTKNDILDLCNVQEDKVKVIYSGVEKRYRKLEENNQDLIRVKAKYKLPNEFIFFLGTIEPRKNIGGLIKAYDKFRIEGGENIKLVIAGGKGWKYKETFKIYENARYKDDIVFLGYIEAREKVYFYNLAKFFVYPSFYEGFGFPCLEAMASGCPVITSAVSSLPEVAGDSALMVDPYDFNSINKAIKKMVESQELRDILIKRGFERSKKFSWERTAVETLKLFVS